VKLSDLSLTELRHRLSSRGVFLKTGPLTFSIRSTIPHVIASTQQLYGEYALEEDEDFADFYIQLKQPAGLRKWYHPQVLFDFDGRIPFKPLPLSQAFPMLEWGMNWCIANHCHHWLIIHAAVVEKDGQGIILPAPPGSGKSTLCAALVGRGWRLLSDELAVIDPLTGELIPIPRPVGLKNDSINIIKAFLPSASFGPECKDTRKGTVAHMAVSAEDCVNTQRVKPKWIVYPKYEAGSDTILEPHPRGDSLVQLASNSFNNQVLGKQGFETLVNLQERTESFDFRYSRLEEAISTFADLCAIERDEADE
jgi:HprK-related kinase A